MLCQSALGQVSTWADRVGPCRPEVPGAEFGLGVRWRLVLTSGGVPERLFGIPPVVVFNPGRGGVPCCWTTQWHTAVYLADPSNVVHPCFGFQEYITFPLSSSPAGTSG